MLHIVDLFHGDIEAGIDFHKLKFDGVDGVLLKATQGDSYIDPKYADTMARVRSVGFSVVGAYHFFTPDAPADVQVEHFLSVAGLKAGEYAALDTEQWGQGTPAHVLTALGLLDKAFGVKVIHYANKSDFAQYFAADPDRLRWVAAYGPRPNGATFWQFTDRARLQGETHVMDESVFFGTLAQFQKYAIPPTYNTS